MPTVDELGRYIAAHVGAFAGDQACPMTEGPRQISSTAGFRRYEFTFECPQAANLKVHSSAWLELVESHTNFAQIQGDKGDFVEQLITKDRQTLPVTSERGESCTQYAGFLDFVQMGIMHIFTGVDHMSFMLGLVLISRRLRDLLFVVTGFTLGHSLTLALAVTGILRPEAQYIDSLVALTIALIGAENIGDSTRHPLPVALGLGGLLFLMAGAKYLGAPVTLPTLLLVGGRDFYVELSDADRQALRRGAGAPCCDARVRPYPRASALPPICSSGGCRPGASPNFLSALTSVSRSGRSPLCLARSRSPGSS